MFSPGGVPPFDTQSQADAEDATTPHERQFIFMTSTVLADIRCSVTKRIFWQKLFSNCFLLSVGAYVFAYGVNSIMIPHQFLSGGVSGMALLGHYLFPSLDTGLLYFALNIPLVILGWFTVSRRFILYTIFGMGAFSLALTIVHQKAIPIENPILAAILAGIICGAGTGISLRSQGSGGGLDVLAVYLNKRFNFKIGTTSFIVSALVLLGGAYIFDIERALYAFIYVFVSGKVIDAVLTGFNQRKSVMIVSNSSDAIAEQILNRLHRGVTFLDGTGAYTKLPKKVIFSIITMTELSKLRELVFDTDPNAFMVVNDTLEVLGYRHGTRQDY